MKRTSPPCLLVVFGASGDLSMRKLLPAIFHLAAQDLLDPSFIVLGFARTEMNDEQFREQAVTALREHVQSEHEAKLGKQQIDEFAARLFYQTGKYDDPASFKALAKRIAELDKERQTQGNYLFYLATPPNVFAPIAQLLSEVGLAASREGDLAGLVAVLHPEVVLRLDRGTTPADASREVRGADTVIAQGFRFAGPGWTTERAVVNGAAGLVISRAGRPMAVASFTVRRGVIVAIDILADPDRLGRLNLGAFAG